MIYSKIINIYYMISINQSTIIFYYIFAGILSLNFITDTAKSVFDRFAYFISVNLTKKQMGFITLVKN